VVPPETNTMLQFMRGFYHHVKESAAQVNDHQRGVRPIYPDRSVSGIICFGAERVKAESHR